MDPFTSITHSQKLSRVSTGSNRPVKSDAIPETDEESNLDREVSPPPFGGNGGGHFEIDEDEDIDFTGNFGGNSPPGNYGFDGEVDDAEDVR